MKSEQIGYKLKTLRKTKKLTQVELADLLGVTRATISNYETGRRAPHIKELERIAKLLGVNLEYFGLEQASDMVDLISRAKLMFSNDNIPVSEKAQVYKEIMRLYLNIESDKN